MQPRFMNFGGAPGYVGESGRGKPSTDDGTLMTGTTLLEIDTGLLWYYDGAEWKRAVTQQERAANELREIRRLLEELLEETRKRD